LDGSLTLTGKPLHSPARSTMWSDRRQLSLLPEKFLNILAGEVFDV
jgi:hypothetical protein